MNVNGIKEFERNRYWVFVLEKVEKDIEKLKEEKHKKKIIQFLYRLSLRIPNQPEIWEKVKECKENIFELKPKPYRLGCYVKDKYILVVHLWRVQKNISSEKRANIRKACEKAKEVQYEFEKTIKRIQNRP